MPDAQPTAAGTLDATPLPHLLVYALDRRLDGTLVLEAPGGARSAIHLEGGAPAKAKTAEVVIHLGRLLLEMGFISEAVHNRTLLEVAKGGVLHGQVLLREQAVDRETLRAALREQVERQILWMFTLPPQTAYGYYAGANFLERWGGEGVRVQPLGLLWRGIRAHADDRRVASTLARLGDVHLHLHPDGQIQRFNFEPTEQAVIDVLRAKPQSLSALAASGLLAEASLRRLVYLLAITRHLDLGVPGAIPVGVDEAPSSSRIAIFDGTAELRRRRRLGVQLTPPVRPEHSLASESSKTLPEVRPPASSRRTNPQLGALVREAQEFAERIGSQDYYAILGVPREAPRDVIQGAFFQLAKRWHPDRVGTEFGDVRELAGRIFTRLSEAHQVLSDEKLRAEYDQVVKEGGASAEEQEQIQAVLRAATAFQKAEVFLKRNNLPAAEEQARIALENDPTEGDYIALYTWIQSQKPGLDGCTLDELIERLDSAISKDPENPRARWYRGQLLKRAGENELAMKDFRFIVDRDPKHLDATREIRLHEMRKASSAGLRNSVPPRGSSPPPRRLSSSSNPPVRRNSSMPVATPKKKPSSSGAKEPGGLLNKIFKR